MSTIITNDYGEFAVDIEVDDQASSARSVTVRSAGSQPVTAEVMKAVAVHVRPSMELQG